MFVKNLGIQSIKLFKAPPLRDPCCASLRKSERRERQKSLTPVKMSAKKEPTSTLSHSNPQQLIVNSFGGW